LCHQDLRTLRGHAGPVHSVAFSPNDEYLASGGQDGTIKIWEVNTGRLLRTLRGHFGEVRSVDWSPNGQHLASGGDDLTARIWDAATGKQVFALGGHLGNIASLGHLVSETCCK